MKFKPIKLSFQAGPHSIMRNPPKPKQPLKGWDFNMNFRKSGNHKNEIFVRIHPSLVHTCPSTNLPQKISPQTQPNHKNEKTPKIAPKNIEKEKLQNLERRLSGARNWSLDYFMRSDYKPLLVDQSYRWQKAQEQEPLITPPLLLTKANHSSHTHGYISTMCWQFLY